jgi:hypothetical protein
LILEAEYNTIQSLLLKATRVKDIFGLKRVTNNLLGKKTKLLLDWSYRLLPEMIFQKVFHESTYFRNLV